MGRKLNFENIRGPHKAMRAEVPIYRYRKAGFGIRQILDEEWQPKIDAVRTVLATVQSETMPESSTELLEQFSLVKGMFSRIAIGDTGDWYTTSRLLGHPSAELSMAMSKRLAFVRGAIKEGKHEIFDEVVPRIHADFIPEMLEHYLGMTVDARHPEMEDGWAYILWSSSERDALYIGAAGGSVEEVLGRLDRENPENDPYGVLGAWLVHEAGDAYQDIHKRLSDYALGGGFFRVDLGVAKKAVAEVLKETDNLSHSPWHSEQQLPDYRKLDIGNGVLLGIR